jgi:2-polyprenyl-3-methyl-5-hydroxy-6-metoxy-1,4-benzoquinol methylase
VTVGPALPELHDSGAYTPQAPRLHVLARPLLDLFDRQRLTLLRSHIPPPARLLDAGAGRGRFVLAAERAGYAARGIEPSSRGIAAAAASGAEVTKSTIDEARIPPASLDVVSLWHVLEHLDDPRAALVQIRGWLRPGGFLLVGVPNLASLQAVIGAERWYHLDVPRHRTHFTAQGLDRLLESSGFALTSTHHVLLEHNPFGMWQSLVNRLTRHPSYLYNLLKRNAPMRSLDLAITVAALPAVPVAAVLELVAGLTGRGGTIASLARLPSTPGGYH